MPSSDYTFALKNIDRNWPCLGHHQSMGIGQTSNHVQGGQSGFIFIHVQGTLGKLGLDSVRGWNNVEFPFSMYKNEKTQRRRLSLVACLARQSVRSRRPKRQPVIRRALWQRRRP